MDQTIYYMLQFGLSFLLTFLYILQWHKQFDEHMTAIFILIPIVNLAYLLLYSCPELPGARSLLKIVYVGGCYIPWLTTLCVVSLCKLPVSRWLRMLGFLISSLDFCGVMTIGHTPWFYRSMSLERVGAVWVQHREYGPLHTLHYGILLAFLAADLLAIGYSYWKKKECSRRIILLLFLPVLITVLSYIASHFLNRSGYEMLPMNYVLGQAMYLLIVRRLVLYNVSEMVIESMMESGDTGFITADAKGRYLGSNETARSILPELRQLTVDRPIRGTESLKGTVTAWLEHYRGEGKGARLLYARAGDDGEEHIYTVNLSDLVYAGKRCGTQIFLQDDTRNQKYIRLLDRYNADLQAEVERKTQGLERMHDRLILGMAAMVESRDNSTGGHIRRTSEGVRLLIDAIRADGAWDLGEDFCRKLIKAAPMHDLGKIAVDDAILRKPGRFTPEEYEKMKSHAAEGARIVHEILQDTDDEDFRRIAENVAHYHHERWDGSGYPLGLKGEEIPLEARIMAVADVYDALVSRRVYKDMFSFSQADRIIREGMGSQFDPRLESVYLSARDALKAYYANEQGHSEA